MDLGSIIKSLEYKSILITGASGFLAKIFMEKVLRSQPNVKKLFVLLRTRDATSAAQRLRDDVIGKKVFNILREEHGTGFGAFISNKVTAVAGDISLGNLGIEDSTLREELWGEISFIVHVAGNTNFDERYDIALDINAMGVKHICEFAKKCPNLQFLLHVSTAYVTRENEGIILEMPLMEETLGGNHSLDVTIEHRLVQERLKGLEEEKATDESIKLSMQELGMQRARLFGWANTYVFTKAIGEMVIGHMRGELPVAILRPTIITSTYNDPFPGWIEGFRTIDPMIASYGKGKLNHFLADPEAPLDVVPGDMVVNAMLAIMAAHSFQRSQVIYHVSTSTRNQMKYIDLVEFSYQYFSKNPCLGRDGMPIRVTSRAALLPTKASFNNLMALRYKLPMQVLRIMNALSFHSLENLYRNLNRKYNVIMRFAELFGHFSLMKARFDDSNLDSLRVALKDESIGTIKFNLDPKCINWEDYFVNVHIPGIVQHLIN